MAISAGSTRPSIPRAPDPDFTPSARQIAPHGRSFRSRLPDGRRRRAQGAEQEAASAGVGRARGPADRGRRAHDLRHGIAIPHGKLTGLPKIVGLFARLESKIDFDAIDDQPVDLVFLLLAPEGAGADHLKALARVSRLLRNAQVCEKLRGAEDRAALYAILTEPLASSQAA
jgi:hypothetical protein